MPRTAPDEVELRVLNENTLKDVDLGHEDHVEPPPVADSDDNHYWAWATAAW